MDCIISRSTRTTTSETHRDRNITASKSKEYEGKNEFFRERNLNGLLGLIGLFLKPILNCFKIDEIYMVYQNDCKLRKKNALEKN